MIVAFAPGGGTDSMARVVASKMTDMLGQPVVVDNRAGAGGTIGTELALRAAPDGYTLYMPTNSYSVNAAFYKLAYDPVNALTPISTTARSAYLMVVHPGVAATSLPAFLQLARSKPGALNYGSTGQGAISHLAGELLKMMAHIDLTHVPYKGTSQVLTDLLSGQIQFTIGAIPPTLPHVRSGKLRALAVTTAERSRVLPDLPTASEAGVPGYEVLSWYAMAAPANLPQAIVVRLNETVRKILALPDVKARFDNEGADAVASTPRELRTIIATDIERWSKVAKALKPGH
jgi:tripartite-type tricarboxylate transporter receptor subunit TctC